MKKTSEKPLNCARSPQRFFLSGRHYQYMHLAKVTLPNLNKTPVLIKPFRQELSTTYVAATVCVIFYTGEYWKLTAQKLRNFIAHTPGT